MFFHLSINNYIEYNLNYIKILILCGKVPYKSTNFQFFIKRFWYNHNIKRNVMIFLKCIFMNFNVDDTSTPLSVTSPERSRRIVFAIPLRTGI